MSESESASAHGDEGGQGDGPRPGTVLVTGCEDVVGAATARRFASAGWTVYAAGQSEPAVSELTAAGCRTVGLDPTDPEEPERVVTEVLEETGQLDCLVINDGHVQRGAVEDVPPRKVRRQFDRGVLGVHRLLRATVPHMRAGEEGRIVVVSGVAGRLSPPGLGIHASARFALEGLSDALRAELSSHGIEVVVVQPGPIEGRFGTEETVAAEDRSAVYEALYQLYDDLDLAGGAALTPPDKVADVIQQAATRADPAPRYPVGRVASVLLWARFFPDTIRDAVYDVIRRMV
ncbi:MAG: SDR family NAD(P)-dependent oxidoreductase [Halobacteriaceae archaeon]